MVTLRFARATWMAAARPFGPEPMTTASGTRCEVSVEPVRRAPEGVDQVLARAEAVTLTLVDVLLERLLTLLQRVDHVLRLGARHARVVRALQQQERRLDPGDMRERRAIAIQVGVLRRIAELALEIVLEVTAGRLPVRL